jgi:hypothetical protein
MNKKGGKVLGVGRDGCVIDPAILCSTKSKISDYKEQVSKVIDITGVLPYKIQDFVEEFVSGNIFFQFDPNGENFLPGLEMCYKKYHQLNNDQKKDIKKCKYSQSPYKSTYINILLKKGLSFQNITFSLNKEDFLRSLGYLLLGAKTCIHDLNILLLDIKADNLLYSEDKDGLFPVFIDFSNDFVITDQTRFMQFITGFNQYYNTWSTEMLMFFIQIMKGKKNYSGIKRLTKDLNDYRGIDLKDSANKTYMNDITKDILKKLLLEDNPTITQKKKIKEFYEKQMCYAIGKVYDDAYRKKVRNQPSFKNAKIEKILTNMIIDSYYDRYLIDDVMHYIQKEVKLTSRKDYLIRNRSPTPPRSLSPAMLASLNSFVNNLRLTPTPSLGAPPGLGAPLPPNLRSSPMTPGSITLPPTPPSKKKKKKKKKKKSRTISYNLGDITPRRLKKMKKPALVKIVRKYKKSRCKTIKGLNKTEIIERIRLFQPKISKTNLKKISLPTLKKMMKTHMINKCKIIKLGDKKQKLHDFILNNIV